MVELKRRLQEINQRVLEARSSRDSANGEIKRLSAELRALRDQYQQVKQQYLDLLNRKKEIYEALAKKREERRRVAEELRSTRELIKRLLNEYRALQNFLGAKRYDEEELRAKLEQLEWQYQTMTLPPEVEKVVINRIRSLESIYVNVKHLNELKSKIEELRNKVQVLRETVAKLSEELKSMVDNYLRIKSEVAELRAKRDELRSRMKEIYDQREKIREVANQHHQELVQLLAEERALREELERVAILLKAKELSRHIEERRRLLYDKAMEALAKYQRGEPITLDEFKVLVEFNLIQPGKSSSES
ncbi:MAG: hypothetical protein QXS92_03895 [Thermofilum sp.]